MNKKKEHIIIKKKSTLGGEPIVKGTRIPVSSILFRFSENGCTIKGVKKVYPKLSKKEIQAALEYSAENID